MDRAAKNGHLDIVK
ncbi:hypothetical protein GQ600_16859 [Phytophthora cactorum]|nr:hypothetical protein GQ600_16859 [Phytophthora cactorum]